ncbi:MAG: arginine N-succinyltransferase [Gammaproteobacteria bacterium]|nr:arginine N-succinyltransferase [Gammaproteobacteria bacterium]
MNNNTDNSDSTKSTISIGWLKMTGIVVLATTIATAVAIWVVSSYIFQKELTPVTLSQKEEQRLNTKLDRLDSFRSSGFRSNTQKSRALSGRDTLIPERYSEENASRELVLSEKELNALLAKNTDLARKLAIDLSDDLASAKLLIPLDDDFPVLGGKTLRVNAGLELAYANGKPVVILKGVSIWGTPIPNSWLGNLKNVDLVREFGGQDGFWKSFAAGIDEIKVEEGSLRIRLKE